MIAKVMMLFLGLTTLSGSRAEASDGLPEAVAEMLNLTIEDEPGRAGTAAGLLINLYEGDMYPRDEKILGCLKEVQRCWEDVVSDAAGRPLCIATARSCRTLVLATSKPPLPIQIEVRPPGNTILYKTLDLCGESFDVSKLHDAAATDADLAFALRYMEQNGIEFSSYCFIHFCSEPGSKTIGFHPIRFNRGEYLGSPSPDTPSYEITIDGAVGQVLLGHYVK